MALSDGQERLRLMETYRNLFYTPIYVAVAGGFLYSEGLNVLFSTVPSGQSGIDLLKNGIADIMQTGISRSLMDLDQGREDTPLHIAEINQRDGFFLISRGQVEDWKWSGLEGATVIPVGFTPVPWMSLRYALNLHGVDLARVKLVEGLQADEALSRFRNGEADYIHMPNPQAQQLIEDGVGHFATAIGPELGHICYSSFAATPDFLESRQETVRKFVRGFYNAQKWLASNDASVVADTAAPFFPETPSVVLERSIRRYKEQNTWAESPVIGEEGFDAMRDLLIDGGLVKESHPYVKVVRPEFALEAITT
jgi:NitT/TauT family transport system substrate-binding protein